MVLSEQENEAIRKAVEQVIFEMHERGEPISFAQVQHLVLNYPPHSMRLKIGANSLKEQEYYRAIDSASRAAWELLQRKPHELRRRVTGEDVSPEAQHETGAHVEREGAQVHNAEVAQGITQVRTDLTKEFVVEPLGPPNLRGNIHPALYDPRPESVEKWIMANVENPNHCFEMYHKHWYGNTHDYGMDPYRASWFALQKALLPAEWGKIAATLHSAQLQLKEKMFRDALVLEKIELTDALKVVKPSMNLAEEYDKRFQAYFKLYNFNGTAATIHVLLEILPQDKLQEELGMLAKVVRENKALRKVYEKDVKPRWLRQLAAKHAAGGAGGGAGGKPMKRPGEEHHKRLVRWFLPK